MKASGSWGYMPSLGSDYLKQHHLVAVSMCAIFHMKRATGYGEDAVVARLGDVCTINPRSRAFQDNFRVSFVSMQNVSEEGLVNATEINNMLK
jgi:hypothetical protein